MKTFIFSVALALALLFHHDAKADPAFDFHSGPCVFGSPASGSAGPVTCRSVVPADFSGVLGLTKGGTGLSSGTSGGILCYTGSTTLVSSPALTTGYLMLGGGSGCPTVSSQFYTDNTSGFPTLNVGKGSTGQVAFWQGTGEVLLYGQPGPGAFYMIAFPNASGTLAQSDVVQTFSALQTFSVGINLGKSTVSGLGTCNGTNKGVLLEATDALTPSWNSTLTGGGAVTVLAMCNGSNWVAH